MPDSKPPIIFEDSFAEPHSIAWRVEPGEWDSANPLIVGEHPWETACPFNAGTVLKDPLDGLWKAWGICFPHLDGFYRGQFDNRLAYFTSEDGVRWTKPQLDGFPCMGVDRSNVLLGLEDIGKCGYPSVIVHPDAEPDRRYEMFLHAFPPYKNPSKHMRGFPVRPEHAEGHPSGIWRYFSADGIHWRPCEGPLDLPSADSIYVTKEADGPYVASHKVGRPAAPGAYVPYDVGAGEQRILVRRESKDGSHWSPYQIILEPDWRDAHDTQFMDMGTIRQDGGVVAVVAVYHCLSQRMDLQLAGSPDGKQWFRPFPRTTSVPNAPLGDCGGGLFYGTPYVIEDGDKLHFYFGSLEGLHGDVYAKVDGEYLQYGGMCRASWEKGRLWALVPAAGGPTQAHATCLPVKASAGKTLYINALTLPDGEISAELRRDDGWEIGPPIEGFGREDCAPFHGDSKCAPLTWKGGDRCPREALLLRLHLTRARLYGFEWRVTS